MRQKILVFASILSVISLLFLCSASLATKSRQSGMGDSSIIIEDESNAINLWDSATSLVFISPVPSLNISLNSGLEVRSKYLMRA